ncbi:MAG: hypothetical protein WBB17_04260, partial [Saprospiraceae bacterium]
GGMAGLQQTVEIEQGVRTEYNLEEIGFAALVGGASAATLGPVLNRAASGSLPAGTVLQEGTTAPLEFFTGIAVDLAANMLSNRLFPGQQTTGVPTPQLLTGVPTSESSHSPNTPNANQRPRSINFRRFILSGRFLNYLENSRLGRPIVTDGFLQPGSAAQAIEDARRSITPSETNN